MDDILYNYFMRDTSATGSDTKTRIDESIRLSIEFEDYLKRYNKQYLLEKFYVIFYMIMQNRFGHFDTKTILHELSESEKYAYFKSKIFKVITKAHEIAKYYNAKGNVLKTGIIGLSICKNYLIYGLGLLFMFRK